MVNSLSLADQQNVFEIPPSETFNDGVGGQQVIYNDKAFRSTGQQDGYTFLQEISFEDIDVTEFRVGLFTQLPWQDNYSGWVCKVEPVADAYTCGSFYIESFLSQATAPVYTDESEQIGYWDCVLSRDSNADLINTTVCKNRMPLEASSYPVGTFRWQPIWGIVEQWAYQEVGGVARWIKLGQVSL